jgi:prepilin-type N-terminal cleavage/methylation domain-containing protein
MMTFSSRRGFTLIELLIVIAVVAVLAVVVLLIINPAELLKQARDSRRVEGVRNASVAMQIYQVEAGSGGSLGDVSTVYVSLIDYTATTTAGTNCSGVGLASSALPPGWAYRCPASSTAVRADGTGWIPVNFASLATGSPIDTLPLDPTTSNTTSSGSYFTYVTDGNTWKITAIFESEKYRPYMLKDGGPDSSLYEIGNGLRIGSFARGLAAFWTFDDGGAPTAVRDMSDNGNDGIMYSDGPTQTATDLHISTDCKVGSCARFYRTNSQSVSTARPVVPEGDFALAGWVKNIGGGSGGLISYRAGGGGASFGNAYLGTNGSNGVGAVKYSIPTVDLVTTVSTMSLSAWQFLAVVRSGTTFQIYLNGELDNTVTLSSAAAVNNSGSGYTLGVDCVPENAGPCADNYLDGILDELRVYRRALSSAEIRHLYRSIQP